MNSKERVMRARRREVPDRVPFDLSYGFDHGNYANAYETEDLETMLSDLPAGRSGAYRGGAVLGFFSSYERHEVPADAVDEYDNAMANYADKARSIGIAID